jgi:hypothetical protein
VSLRGEKINPWTVTHENKDARYLAHREAAEAAAAANGHPEARGQWNAPLDYDDDGIGAAPDGSTSQAESTGGEITAVADDLASAAAAESPTGAEPPREANAFDRDGDGVFDAVEAWLGEDLLPEQSGLPDLPDQPGSAAFLGDDSGHSHGEFDLATFQATHQNAALPDDVLEEVLGGGELLAGAPAHSWNQMVSDAAEEGVTLQFINSYRDHDHQQRLVDQKGIFNSVTNPTGAAPVGRSNHGWGLAGDVDRTQAGAVDWLRANGEQYGWRNTVSSEPWHWGFKGDFDDPRWLEAGSALSDEDSPAGHAFDRDGDGVYDGIEDWLAAAGNPLPDRDHVDGDADHDEHAHDEHAHDDHAHDDHAHEGSPAGLLGDALPPIDDAEGSALAEVLGRFDLDGDGELVIDGLTGEDRAGVRSALADFVVERAEIDRESFFRQFDDTVSEGGGAIDIGDVLDVFGLDLDF